jgi:hypothetical protein
MNSILVPLRFLLQVRDDIHLLATSSRHLAETVDRLVQFEVELLDRLDRIDTTTKATVARLETIDRAVERLNASSGTLAAAVEPLQGISERIARITERLPGGRAEGVARRRPRGSPKEPEEVKSPPSSP